MGHLTELTKLNLLVYGEDEADFYKKNTVYFLEKYMKSDNDVKAVRLGEIKPGRFYFLHYMDDSNWMKYSPVFVIEHKTFNNMIILSCVNMNFLPLIYRVALFDPFMKEEDFTNKNFVLKAKFENVFKELKRYGFQWAIMEFNLAQIQLAHLIDLELLPRFLYSGHPKAKYDPGKLTQIWKKKIVEQDKRDQEIASANIKDFFDITKEIGGKYDALKGHISRLQKSVKKYGGR